LTYEAGGGLGDRADGVEETASEHGRRLEVLNVSWILAKYMVSILPSRTADCVLRQFSRIWHVPVSVVVKGVGAGRRVGKIVFVVARRNGCALTL